MTTTIPLSLYIHFPWCIQKCPYCDFNSHKAPDSLPEEMYVDRLLEDLKADLKFVQNRKIQTIFLGGGTPSLIGPASMTRLLEGLQKLLFFERDIEITIEANPGTVDQAHFNSYRECGINRLSLGVQSFHDQHLKVLGRIHDGVSAQRAIDAAMQAGFDNLNLDLMYGLPQQTPEQALQDLETALSFQTSHLSWYQLTIEPNTVFYSSPPTLPSDDTLVDLETQAYELIKTNGLERYEVSAFAKPEKACRHNVNYWQFGDYLGIGAGAHSKLTDLESKHIVRLNKVRQPKAYLYGKTFIAAEKTVRSEEMVFEFMLGALRLEEAVDLTLFESRTGLSTTDLHSTINRLEQQKLLRLEAGSLYLSERGKLFRDTVIQAFLPDQRIEEK